jgi:MiaB-like tRNA modifying enzyme
MKKVYASVYGCPSNIADYEIALGLLKRAGFEIVGDAKKSDLNLIFTCVVKAPSENRMIEKIQQLTKLDKPLIVAGCMTKTSQRMIEKINPNASLLGPDSIEHVAEVVRAALEGKKVIFVSDERKTKLSLSRLRKNKNVGIITISTGCNQSCSYCCVRFARGKLFSYPVNGILADVKQAIKDGCEEIWLTSQDNDSYSYNEVKLPQLLKEVCKIPGDFKIRVGMMNPTYIKNEKLLCDLIESYKNDKVQKFLHIPVQSGSDRILRAMKRGYTVAEFEKIVEQLRKEIPEIYISTDIIVGFPSESKTDFNQTVELIKRMKPNKVNISKFGARPGTEAAKMKQMPVETINERSRKLYEVVKKMRKNVMHPSEHI